MMMKTSLLFCLLFPLLLKAQNGTYLFLQTEVDPMNAIFGGTVNDPGYDGVFQFGLNATWFRAALFYETFTIIDYQSAGANLTYLFNSRKSFKQGIGIQLSVIDKPRKLEPSAGINGLLEYHLNKIFFSARAQSKLRTDWGEKVVNSGFLGIGYKINSLPR